MEEGWEELKVLLTANWAQHIFRLVCAFLLAFWSVCELTAPEFV